MRKIFLLIIALAITSACAQAQVPSNMQSLVGFNYFYSMNTIGCDASNINKLVKLEPGYGFGVTYKHTELANIIGIQLEANYETQKFRIEPNETLYYERQIKYLNTPIYAHVDIGKHAVKGIFAIGTYGSFALDKGRENTNITDWDTSSVKRIHEGRLRTFSYGLCGQIGFAICTKAGVLEFLGRAQIGMSKMVDMGDVELFNYAATRSFQAGVSYLVPFGKGDKYYTKRERIRKEKEDKGSDEPVIEEAASDGEAEPQETDQTDTPEQEENWEERM